MEIMSGRMLLNKRGKLMRAYEVLQGKKLILFYFAAEWCPYSEIFLPKLKAFYKEANKGRYPVEIIYVSSDNNEEQMMKHFLEAHGNWYAVEYTDSLIFQLQVVYSISGIPVLTAVDRDGFIITKNGRKEIEDYGLNVCIKWI